MIMKSREFIMTETIEHMKSRMGELSGSDRAELAYYLLSTLEPVDEGVEEAWQQEISRRLTERLTPAAHKER
jgi:Putative addiction module component